MQGQDKGSTRLEETTLERRRCQGTGTEDEDRMTVELTHADH